jgi:methionyl-tRNA formyltransferase
MEICVVATIKPWHINAFNQRKSDDFLEWVLVDSLQDLSYERMLEIKPRYIFFPHWSWIVPDKIIDNFECVCFHSSDVPYGRGGSPIQNLIIREFTQTKISALRMTKELDAGPVYLKKELSLKGRAQNIYDDSALIITDMMKWIFENKPKPIAQEGIPTVFKRRQRKDNLLPNEGKLSDVYNHIRMLDADTYPKSFINHGQFKIEFFDSIFLNKDIVEAKVKITMHEKN